MMPEKIDRYEIKGEIGRGGMATVYEAYDPRFERTVAVKVLPREFMHDPEFRTRFTREAKVIASLEHPAIVPVYDFGEHDGQPFIIMRIMRGGSLLDRLQNGPLPIDETAEILKRLGSALDRAHSQGIVHRDMKPSNVLFDEYGDSYLADFGIVRVSTSSNALTASGSLLGTPTYMSPEQVYGDKELDGRSDIYALGVILFQMLTGTVPYEADTPARMMMKHLMDPVPQIKTVRPDLPDDIEDVIHKAMAKERAERFPSARDFSSALTEITKKTKRDELAAELKSMQEDLQVPPLEAPVSEEEPAPPAESPPPAEPAETADSVETAVPGPPSPSTFSEASPSVDQAKSGGLRIPLWVWAAVALLLIICVVGVGGSIWFVSQNGFAALNPASATPVAARVQDVPTETPTSAPTDEPTATLTATDAATETPMPTETAVVDADGTRESLAATRDAATAGTPSGEPDNDADALEATRLALEAERGAVALETAAAPRFAPLFGPADGELAHRDDSVVQSEYATVDLQNFYLDVTFENPYGPSVGGWDFGITFRQVDLNDELRLVIRSDGSWNLNERLDDEDNFIHEDRMGAVLDLAENGRNHIQLIALGETGYFFINNTFVDTLDLSSHVESGDIAIGTGYYTSDVQPGSATGFVGYSVWELEAAHGPETSAMDHIDNDFIKTSYTDLVIGDFIARTTFTNPYEETEAFGWDYGFVFRDIDTNNQYWLVVTSGARWELINRTEEEDITIDDGFLDNMNLEANGTNELLLIAQNDLGALFVNGVFITGLDLSAQIAEGEMGVFTAFFIDNEIEGSATAFDNFTVWSLP